MPITIGALRRKECRARTNARTLTLRCRLVAVVGLQDLFEVRHLDLEIGDWQRCEQRGHVAERAVDAHIPVARVHLNDFAPLRPLRRRTHRVGKGDAEAAPSETADVRNGRYEHELAATNQADAIADP